MSRICSTQSTSASRKSPLESYARQSSSVGTDCIIINAMVTTQPSKIILDKQDSHFEHEADELRDASELPLLNATKEASALNALIPRRDSKDFSEPLIVARPQSVPTIIADGEIPMGGSKPPTYQEIISPMPLLLDNRASSITYVPTCLCEDGKGENDSSTSSTITYGNEHCYSSRPTPSELSINAPDCRDGDSDSANFYVFHNRASQIANTDSDSVVELWQQVELQALGTAMEQNARFTTNNSFPYDAILANKRLDEEKISSV